ncbi:hypothetical protein [Edaphobacter aggregans]|uniref:hypothetical protein n=1 Tax=Edaphobacter aggregans TaxID=570835 RepID=UPI0005540583|nr:hypothetical protein [Edaphobacter aggregans]
MTRTKVSFTLSLFLAALMGCHSNAPQTPTVESPKSTNAAPTPQGCAAITDPALAEDCRFRAEVEAKRKKSKASPVVTHAPGTIQQP